MTGAITSIDKLQVWFENLPSDYHYGTVYTGFLTSNKRPPSRREMTYDLESGTKEELWEKIEEHLNLYNGGRKTIYVTTKSGSTNGLKTYVQFSPRNAVAGIGSASDQYASLHGYSNIGEMVASARKDEREKVEMEMRLQALEQQVKEATVQGFWSHLGNMFAEDPQNAMQFLAGLMQTGMMAWQQLQRVPGEQETHMAS